MQRAGLVVAECKLHHNIVIESRIYLKIGVVTSNVHYYLIVQDGPGLQLTGRDEIIYTLAISIAFA